MRLHAAGDQPIPDPDSGKGTVRVPVMRTAFLFTAGLLPVDGLRYLGFSKLRSIAHV
ncbi:hypothetical protein [Desulfosporosinus lacus]|uniref:hypothetical protein n=1 Tax=Desulfosporosinus lacus TaxID=329936 RepID=UPI00190E8B8F|nr:hypothetical protein [Desulfosporosinus lacus]